MRRLIADILLLMLIVSVLTGYWFEAILRPFIRLSHFLIVAYVVLIYFNDLFKYIIARISEKWKVGRMKMRRKLRALKR